MTIHTFKYFIKILKRIEISELESFQLKNVLKGKNK